MQATTSVQQRFVRRTSLLVGEYRRDFRQIDRDAITVVTSADACRITNLMSKIYLRLVDAPANVREADGILRFTGIEQDGKWVTAWEQLTLLLGVASATANKALIWLHEQGVIGYNAHRNGVGIRIFLNRATHSIGMKMAAGKEKNLLPIHTSLKVIPTSPRDVCFKDKAQKEVLDNEIYPPAQKNSAANATSISALSDSMPHTAQTDENFSANQQQFLTAICSNITQPMMVADIVGRVRSEIESSVLSAAAEAAAREHERTREWLEKHGLPKAARVAQREAYNVFKQRRDAQKTSESGKRVDGECMDVVKSPAMPSPMTWEAIREAAEICVAMLEVQNRPIEATLAEMSIESGGWMRLEDLSVVRQATDALLLAKSG